MAPTSLKRTSKGVPSGRSKKAKVPNNDDSSISIPETEWNANQNNQVEDDEARKDIKNTASKLHEFENADDGLDRWCRTFAKQLYANRAEALDLISKQQKIYDEARKEHEDQFLALLTTALEPIHSDKNAPPARCPLLITQTVAEGQPLHQQSELLITESKALIGEYNELANREQIPSRLQGISEKLKENQRQAKGMFKAGRFVASREIEKLLADSFHEVQGRGQLNQEEQQNGNWLLQQADMEDDGLENIEGWGKIADRAIDAVQKLQAVIEKE